MSFSYNHIHISRVRPVLTVCMVMLAFLFTRCGSEDQQAAVPAIAFTGATIIDGEGGAPVPHGVLIVQSGKIVAVGSADAVKVPAGAEVVDIKGRFIMPGIINAHGHVGDVRGIDGGHYSHDNVIDNLATYARYGVTTVVSLGNDKKDSEDLRHVNDSTATGRARLFIAGDVINGGTPGEATAVVDSNAHMGVDFMKIRVDDNLGTSPKMAEEIYKPVIARSHQLGYKIATHMYYLDDAVRLLNAGSDMLAHSVRDKMVDEAFISLIKSKNVPYCATLTRELSTFVYGDTAEFFSDPFFLREYDTTLIKPLLDPAAQTKMRESRNAKIYRQQLPTAMANLKTLHDAGVHIVFGTDSGVPTRFMGYFEHLELDMMAQSGMKPMDIILTATRDAAKYMGLKNLGTLATGNWADFIILTADPVVDIKNSRSIESVYIGGEKVKE